MLPCVGVELQDYYNAVYMEVAETRGRGPSRYPDATRDLPRAREVPQDPDAPFPLNGDCVLKLRGLPFTAGGEDVADWFNTDPTLGLQPIGGDRCAGAAASLVLIVRSLEY